MLLYRIHVKTLVFLMKALISKQFEYMKTQLSKFMYYIYIYINKFNIILEHCEYSN